MQYEQEMVAPVENVETTLFLPCLRCSAAAILLALWSFASVRTDAGQFGLSIAACSHVLWLILKAFSESKDFKSVLEPFPLASMGGGGMVAMLEFAKQELLEEPIVWCISYKACLT